MTCLRYSAFLIALFALTRPATSDEPANEVKRLAGKWRGTEGAWSGKALTAEQARQCILTIDPQERTPILGPQLNLSVPERLVGYQIWSSAGKLEMRYTTAWEGYRLSLDLSSTPRALTALKLVGYKGVGFGGIYRIEGDTLTVCFTFNRLEKLPKEFESPRRSEVLVLTLKRHK